MMSLSPQLLAALREAGLAVEPHRHTADAWFADGVVDGLGGGNIGPFEDDEAALVAGVRWLIGLGQDARTERDAMWLDLRRTKRALETAQAELRAEREAKGPTGRGAPVEATPVPPPRRFRGTYSQVPVAFEAALVWTLMRRAGLFIAERDGAWQWTIDPPSRSSYRIGMAETLWYGPYNSPSAAFAGALAALIGFADEG